MAAGKAHIGMLAPDFTAKAVMPDGQFDDLKLSDYRGKPPPVSPPPLEWRTCFDEALFLTVIHFALRSNNCYLDIYLHF